MIGIDLIKKHGFFILGGVCLIIVGVIYILSRTASPAEVVRSGENLLAEAPEVYASAPAEQALTEAAPIPIPMQTPEYIFVHIVGAVNSPGVFELPAGARVNDVLTLAGGETQYADLTQINLAAVLQDAMQIIVPEFGEDIDAVFVFGGTATGQTASQADGLININTATAQELQALPGVGPVLAQNIIDFRESHGGFTSVDELIHVTRIGQATLERLRPLVVI